MLPPREDKPTITDKPQEAPVRPPWHVRWSLVALAVFVVSSAAGGFLWDIWRPAGHGFLGLALSSLVAAWLLGSD